MIQFGPDGLLYLGLGDGGGAGDPSNNAQNDGTLLGKLVRMNVDTGVVDEFEAVHGRNLHEWDFYYGDANTDGGRISSHGTSVALAVEQTNSALERIDLQVGPNAGSSIGLAAADAALNRLITLHDQGWNIGSVTNGIGAWRAARTHQS